MIYESKDKIELCYNFYYVGKHSDLYEVNDHVIQIKCLCVAGAYSENSFYTTTIQFDLDELNITKDKLKELFYTEYIKEFSCGDTGAHMDKLHIVKYFDDYKNPKNYKPTKYTCNRYNTLLSRLDTMKVQNKVVINKTNK